MNNLIYLEIRKMNDKFIITLFNISKSLLNSLLFLYIDYFKNILNIL